MRRATVLFALLALAATRGDCTGAGGGAYDPCAGRACGDACALCQPGVPGCFETAVVKACDPLGRCQAATPDLCAPAAAACAWRACVAPCVVEPACRSAVPPCMLPSLLGLCDRDGTCETRLPVGPGFCAPPLPDPGCRGKACGDACGLCPAGTDPAACPVPSLAATACDRDLRCVTAGTFSCAP